MSVSKVTKFDAELLTADQNKGIQSLVSGLVVNSEAAAQSNLVAIQAALNNGGLVKVSNPGTIFIPGGYFPGLQADGVTQGGLIFYGNTTLELGPQTVIKIATNKSGNFGLNSAYNAPLSPVTGATPGAASNGEFPVVFSTTATDIVAGGYCIIKGDPREFYNGVWPVDSVVPGTSVTVRMPAGVGGTLYTLSPGADKFGIIGYRVVASGSGYLSSLSRTQGSFVVPVLGGSGSGALVQVDVYNGAITQAHVMEPGQGYTSIAGLTVDLASTPYGGTGGAIQVVGMMTIARADGPIVIRGGAWDWNLANALQPPPLGRNGFMFNRTRGTRIERTEFREVSHYAVAYANVKDFTVQNIDGRADCACQGLGPVWNVNINNVRGQFSDDAVAISVNNGTDLVNPVNDYSVIDLPDCNGRIDGFHVDEVTCSASGNLVAVFAGRGFPLHDIKLRNLHGLPGASGNVPMQVSQPGDGSTGTGTNTLTLNNALLVGPQIGSRVYHQGVPVGATVTALSADRKTITLSATTTLVTNKAAVFLPPDAGTNRVGGMVTIGCLGWGYGYINDVLIDGVQGDVQLGSSFISLAAPQGLANDPSISLTEIGSLTIRNVDPASYRDRTPYITQAPSTLVRRAVVETSTFKFNTTSVSSDNLRKAWLCYGTLRDLLFSRCRSESLGDPSITASWFYASNTGGSPSVERVRFSDCSIRTIGDLYGSTNFVAQQITLPSPPTYSFSGVSLVNANLIDIGPASHCNLMLNGIDVSGSFMTYNLIRDYSSTSATIGLNVSNVRNTSNTGLMDQNSASVISLKSGDSTAKLDITKLSRAGSAGAMCLASSNTGTGSASDILANNLVVCDATGVAGSWKQLSAPATRSY